MPLVMCATCVGPVCVFSMFKVVYVSQYVCIFQYKQETD